MTNTCSCSKDNHRKENYALLKAANLKTTKKRMELINCLRHSEKPMTAEDIYHEVRKNVNINLSTVYRALGALVDAKILTRQILLDGNNIYELCKDLHHHILTCKVCGQSTYIEMCPVEDMKDDIAAKTGYEITGHNLEFVGVCPDCIKNMEND
ncbi:Fur family transcriptional regulator [Peptostreptococcus sp. MV1]|uniref:Fur family transcriptional regulator n=1 Tax=Peptostreptococcus sp. MV1 TaxID=1219626 RepID=UPI00050EA62A|nr:Fur family transcriptional regulator [Peptostreptococcus sp. MV1]KGF10450.1 Fur family transcriptional regulator [Peptostreptococcus sp. MV1]